MDTQLFIEYATQNLCYIFNSNIYFRLLQKKHLVEIRCGHKNPLKSPSTVFTFSHVHAGASTWDELKGMRPTLFRNISLKANY